MAYGDMKHRKWFKGKVSKVYHEGWRRIATTLEVKRVGDTGERKVQPYRAIACVGSRGKSGSTFPRLAATRCGEARGKTPTLAIRGAFKDLGRNFK